MGLPMTAEALLWIDVETTGLDPATDHLLEIAAVPTTFDADFAQIGEPFSVLVYPRVAHKTLNPHVRKMHSATRLWPDARQRGIAEKHALTRFRNALIDWDLRDTETVYLAGRSVHFDRDWLVPRGAFTDLALSHRLFDLTPIKAFANLCGVTLDIPEDAHRALADVEADIALARSMIVAFTKASA